MIKIHRSEQVVTVGKQRIQLSKDEHLLLVSLGMMDNKFVQHDLLLDILYPQRIPASSDLKLLSLKICRLRKKIGAARITNSKWRGYSLIGDVRFIGLEARGERR